MRWNQDPEAIRKRLSGLHKRTRNLEAPVHLATVSGVLSTKTALIRHVDEHLDGMSVITTKSFQVTPNSGNREPIICEMESGSFGNSVGLRNPGMAVALEELRALRAQHPMRALLNVSVSGSCVEDFITLVGAFEEVADIIELNFSCPHAAAGYGSAIGCSSEISSHYVRAIREAYKQCNALIFPKLTPNVDDIGAIARELVEAGADGIVAINTVGPEVHIEPISAKPILQNKLGGKGGKSGRWVRERALECVRQIRAAVGPDVPVIGMGGVGSGTDIAAMIDAGADVVGVGSAFGKVSQQDWKPYVEALVRDASAVLRGSQDPRSAAVHLKDGNSMTYHRRRIVARRPHGTDTVILTLEGSWDYEAGQFVFLWIPQVGEKPFSIAEREPLTFVIKRRGEFTNALYDLGVGDDLYLRGLYGAPVKPVAAKRAILVAGGTGVAVLPALARKLQEQQTAMTIFIGTSERDGTLLEQNLRPYGPVLTVCDDGIPGRILQSVAHALEEPSSLSCYIVGPTAFMRAAACLMLEAGVDAARILLSLELSTLCGIGMCGECLCGERLTCAWGTFMDYRYVRENAPELL